MKFMTYFSLGALAVFMLGALLETSGSETNRNTPPIPANAVQEQAAP